MAFLRNSNIEKDDTHLRYDKQEVKAKRIWQKYNEQIVPNIIRHALAKQPFTLEELYQILSVARFSCEFEKNKDLEDEDSLPASKSDVMSNTRFGAFIQGGSAERNINNTAN